MANTRRVQTPVVRQSFSLKEENVEWLKERAATRQISVSALLDALIDVCRRKM